MLFSENAESISVIKTCTCLSFSSSPGSRISNGYKGTEGMFASKCNSISRQCILHLAIKYCATKITGPRVQKLVCLRKYDLFTQHKLCSEQAAVGFMDSSRFPFSCITGGDAL